MRYNAEVCIKRSSNPAFNDKVKIKNVIVCTEKSIEHRIRLLSGTIDYKSRLYPELYNISVTDIKFSAGDIEVNGFLLGRCFALKVSHKL